MNPPRRRRLRAVPLIAGVTLALLALQLGHWQTRRAAEKTALQAEYLAPARSQPQALGTGSPAESPAEWQTVELRGQWHVAGSILLDNRVHGGRAGYHVITPLQLTEPGVRVLVNRGWVPASPDRARLPEITTPDGPVTVTGRVRHPADKPFTLGAEAAAPAGIVWQNLDLQRYRAASQAAVADFYLQQTSAAVDGLIRDWPQPDAGIERHRGYAVQWYALALLATALTLWYVWNAFRSIQRDKRTHH
ncbi:SURF1 family protein [Aromatoleum diolicum]|uniref:SURF1-like protein n=2 Tax=Aromatoleum diolicum TaxID=75796 RepID=A0ABX1QEP7_9RHOO|nr:SURF1 family protein [Aromatoleum diolicum]NMG75972.1 SURF1 family protein [Aromatoleum diolicum]